MAFTENLNVYFNQTNGFATTHLIDGVSIVCVVGDVVAGQSIITGAFVDTMDITFKVADLAIPVKEQPMLVDSERWVVGAVERDPSIFTATLERPQS